MNYNHLWISNIELVEKIVENESEFKKAELSGYFKDLLRLMSIYIES